MRDTGGERVNGRDAPEAVFWRTHIHAGVILWAAGSLVVLGYLLGTPSGPHRGVLSVLVLVSMVGTVALLWGLGLHVVQTRWQAIFFGVWTTVSVAAIGVSAWLDGGTRSPLFVLLVLPVLFAGLAYSPAGTAATGGVAVVTAAAVGITTAHVDQARTIVMVTAMLIIGTLTLVGAFNRRTLQGQLRQMASHDGLTGCLTHRAFHQRLDEEVERARRYGRTLSLVMADVDNLKELNDTQGHHAGDAALSSLAESLRAAARDTDLVGRLGGDEFAVLLPETGPREVGAALARLEATVHEGGAGEPITVSFGASTWAGADDEPAVMLLRADEALYAAKQAGRDRSVTWSEAIEVLVGEREPCRPTRVGGTGPVAAQARRLLRGSSR